MRRERKRRERWRSWEGALGIALISVTSRFLSPLTCSSEWMVALVSAFTLPLLLVAGIFGMNNKVTSPPLSFLLPSSSHSRIVDWDQDLPDVPFFPLILVSLGISVLLGMPPFHRNSIHFFLIAITPNFSLSLLFPFFVAIYLPQCRRRICVDLLGQTITRYSQSGRRREALRKEAYPPLPLPVPFLSVFGWLPFVNLLEAARANTHLFRNLRRWKKKKSVCFLPSFSRSPLLSPSLSSTLCYPFRLESMQKKEAEELSWMTTWMTLHFPSPRNLFTLTLLGAGWVWVFTWRKSEERNVSGFPWRSSFSRCSHPFFCLMCSHLISFEVSLASTSKWLSPLQVQVKTPRPQLIESRLFPLKSVDEMLRSWEDEMKRPREWIIANSSFNLEVSYSCASIYLVIIYTLMITNITSTLSRHT